MGVFPMRGYPMSSNTGKKTVGRYTFIIGLLFLNLYMIVVMFSSYFVRREIEQELAQPGLNTTIEEMRFNLEVTLTGHRRISELRCLQRDAITMYRLSSLAYRQAIGQIYEELRPTREALRQWVASQSGLDVARTQEALDVTWGLAVGTELVFAPGTGPEQREALHMNLLRTARSEIDKLFAKSGFRELLQTVLVPSTPTTTGNVQQLGPDSQAPAPRNMENVIANAEDFMTFVKKRGTNALFHVDAAQFERLRIQELESAIARIRDQLKGFQLADEGRRRGVLLRLLVAERGITGATPGSSLLDRLQAVFDLERTNETRLGAHDCEPHSRALINGFHDAFSAAIERSTWDENDKTQMRRLVDHLARGVGAELSTAELSFWSRLQMPHAWMAGWFIGLPTAAQTLIVCMLFGSLGALCFQALRISNFGYWASVADPTWGEVFTSVLLGTAAAMVIYLLAAVGMLVVSDGRGASGATNVGAGLVALLGFISGLLNDSAFARIRRFGQQIFSGDGARSDLQLSGADIELQKVLKDAGALRFAELARIHEIGRDLAKRGRFTIFVPDDAAFDALPHARWRELADPGNATPFLDLVLHRLVTAHRYDLKTIGGYQGIGIRNSVASTDPTKTSMTFGFPAGSPAAAPETVDGWSIDAKRRDISLFADDVGVLHVIGLPPGATPTRPL